MKNKLLIGGLVVLVLVVAGVYFGTGGTLQGRLGGGSPVLGKPDLVIQDIYIEGDSLLTIQQGNQGKVKVSATTEGTTDIYIDDLTKASKTYFWSTLGDKSFLSKGGSSLIQPSTLEEGSYTIKACVDATETVSESDETNNCLEEEIGFGGFPTVELSSISPSGLRAVSASDSAFTFKVSAKDTGGDILLEKISIDLVSENDFDTEASLEADLVDSGSVVGTAAVTVTDASNAVIEFIFGEDEALGEVELDQGETRTYTVRLSTITLLDEDAEENPLTFSIDLGSSSHDGGFWWSDDSGTKKWLGPESDTTLTSNEVTY